MKQITYISIVLFLLSLGLISCSGTETNSGSDKDTTAVVETTQEVSAEEANTVELDSIKTSNVSDALGVEYTAKYICPNHCKGSGSDKEGECKNPDCGMELMENPNYKEQ